MAFHHGLSGLNAASKKLDVVGQNIANSSTTGFKASRAEFTAMVASAMGGCGCAGNGIGVSTQVSQQFSQGVITPTSNVLDMAINGNGFFQVQTGSGETAYTRMGNFQLSKAGDLITSHGDKVMGYPLDPQTGDITGQPVAINFPSGGMGAKQTTQIAATLNLDARTEPGTPRAASGTSLQVYDTLGIAHPVQIYFEKQAPQGSNTWEVFDGLDDPAAVPPVVANSLGTITFNADGSIQTNPATVNFAVAPDPATGATAPIQLSLDLSKATQYGNSFAVSRLTQDGYAAGEFIGVNVSEDGTLMASYSNGVTRGEARIALATFTNPQGLLPTSNGNWVMSSTSGEPVPGTPGSGSFGSITGSALEESNVDLTAELVEMMNAQRYYQANAQTIKTQDQVFSTITNLR